MAAVLASTSSHAAAAPAATPAAAATPVPDSTSPPTADAFLTAQAKLALWTTAGLRSDQVHVDTTDGVVTLYGKVPTDGDRSLAEKTALAQGGVKSVKNLLQVVAPRAEKATARSDKEILETANKRLKADVALSDSHITVKSVDKGMVLLTGDAASFSDHLRAIVCVDHVPGVKHIATEVKTPSDFREDERVIFVPQAVVGGKPSVDATAGHTNKHGASDTRISAEVKLRLLLAPQVPSSEISVDTDEGEVILFGMVPTAAVKNAAALEAARVSGVRRVDNQLEIVPSAIKSAVVAQDSDITRDLALAFKDHDDLKGITTTVKNGTVRLTGTVHSGWEQLRALRLTRGVPGVRGIENQLKVE
jgi:osmotically-inducible protein OsmY